MTIEQPSRPSEIQLFHEYLGKRLQNSGSSATLEEALADFQDYKRQLEDIKDKLREAEQDVIDGRVGPFNSDATKTVVRERLAQKGMTD